MPFDASGGDHFLDDTKLYCSRSRVGRCVLGIPPGIGHMTARRMLRPGLAVVRTPGPAAVSGNDSHAAKTWSGACSARTAASSAPCAISKSAQRRPHWCLPQLSGHQQGPLSTAVQLVAGARAGRCVSASAAAGFREPLVLRAAGSGPAAGAAPARVGTRGPGHGQEPSWRQPSEPQRPWDQPSDKHRLLVFYSDHYEVVSCAAVHCVANLGKCHRSCGLLPLCRPHSAGSGWSAVRGCSVEVVAKVLSRAVCVDLRHLILTAGQGQAGQGRLPAMGCWSHSQEACRKRCCFNPLWTLCRSCRQNTATRCASMRRRTSSCATTARCTTPSTSSRSALQTDISMCPLVGRKGVSCRVTSCMSA